MNTMNTKVTDGTENVEIMQLLMDEVKPIGSGKCDWHSCIHFGNGHTWYDKRWFRDVYLNTWYNKSHEEAMMGRQNKDNTVTPKAEPLKRKAEKFASQMHELKEFLHKEIQRGIDAVEIEKKLDKRINQIVSEVRNYERLEHIIDTKAKEAISSVNKRLGIFSFILAITGLLGWSLLVEHTTQKAISEIAGTAAHDIITAVVSNQVDFAQREVSQKVTREIESRVPEMISSNVSDLRVVAKTADENIKAVQSVVDTMTIVTAARANSRCHYNQLRALANGTNNTVESRIACDAIKTIQGQYEQNHFSFDLYRLTLTKDGLQKELEDLVYIARADHDHNCSGAVSDLIALNNKELVGTFVHVVKNTKRLDTLNLAMMGIERLTGKRFHTLDSDSVLNWWKDECKNKSYHSDYEWYCDMLDNIYCHKNREQIIAASTNMINEAHNRVKADPDFHIASKFIIDTIISLPDYNAKISDGRKSYFEQALKNLERSPYQNGKWYVYKAYYLAIAEAHALNGFVNERLSTNPEFEDDLKKSRHFTEQFFNDKEIKWPSKLPPEKRTTTPHPNVLTIPLNRAPFVINNAPPVQTPPRAHLINSRNVSGYCTIEIKKGIQPLTELPTNGVPSSALQKLKDLKSGVCNGDSISWNLDSTAFKYKFVMDKWCDDRGIEISDDITIPTGFTLITYERIKEEKSKITFTVSMEFNNL